MVNFAPAVSKPSNGDHRMTIPDLSRDPTEASAEAIQHAFRMTLGLSLGRIMECCDEMKRTLTEHTKMMACLDARVQSMATGDKALMEQLRAEVREALTRIGRLEISFSEFSRDMRESEKARQEEIARVQTVAESIREALLTLSKSAK